MPSLHAFFPLLAQAAAATGTTINDSLSLPIKFAIAAAVIGGSIALGSLLARMLRMPELRWALGRGDSAGGSSEVFLPK